MCTGIAAYTEIRVDWVRAVVRARHPVQRRACFLLVYIALAVLLPVVPTAPVAGRRRAQRSVGLRSPAGSPAEPDMRRPSRYDHRAGVAQLAERQPSKLHVASSNLVSRSIPFNPRVERHAAWRLGPTRIVDVSGRGSRCPMRARFLQHS